MTARNLEGQYAGFLTRAVGLALDYAIIIAVVLVGGLLIAALFGAFGINLGTCGLATPSVLFGAQACTAGRLIITLYATLFGPIYFVLLWMVVGQSVGQRVMGVSVVKMDGRRPGLISSLGRWIGYQLCMLTLGIGFLWVLVDDRRMGWHDKIARTYVIYSWKAVQNEGVVARVKGRFRRKQRAAVRVEEGEVS
jgi:uncharacterized RDD family membrane protein YckC